jgi:hypothetical protein
VWSCHRNGAGNAAQALDEEVEMPLKRYYTEEFKRLGIDLARWAR